MALVGKSFAEQYLALVSHQPTYGELLTRTMREEHGARKSIEDEYRNRVEDIFFQIGVMNSDRKTRSNLNSAAAVNSKRSADGAAAAGRSGNYDAAGNKRAIVTYDKRTMAVMERENAVWLPEEPPRHVDLPAVRHFPGFPFAAYRKLADEEAELRDWLTRVQDRLREAMEQQKGERYYIVMCLLHCEESELETRRKIETNEEDELRMIRRREFRDAPSSLFRRLAKQKSREKRLQLGALRQQANEDGSKAEGESDTDSYLLEAYGDGAPLSFKSIETVERLVREGMEEEQSDECASIYQWLQDMYGVRIFSTRRKEIGGRDGTSNAWACGLWNHVITPACIDTFGPDHQTLGAVAWHVSDSKLPLLRALTSRVATAYSKVKPASPSGSRGNKSQSAGFGRMYATLHGVAHSSADSTHNQLLQALAGKASSGKLQHSQVKNESNPRMGETHEASASSRMYSTLEAVANHSSTENSHKSLLQALSDKASSGVLQHEQKPTLRSSPPTSEKSSVSSPRASRMYSTLEAVSKSSPENSRNPLLQSFSEKASSGALQRDEKTTPPPPLSSSTPASEGSTPPAGHMYSALEAVAKSSSESSRNPLLQSLSEKATAGALQHNEKISPSPSSSAPVAETQKETSPTANNMYTTLEAVVSSAPESSHNPLLHSLSKKASTGVLLHDHQKKDDSTSAAEKKASIPQPPPQRTSDVPSVVLAAPKEKQHAIERVSSLVSETWYEV